MLLFPWFAALIEINVSGCRPEKITKMSSQVLEERRISGKSERQGLYPPPFLGPAPHTDILGYQVLLLQHWIMSITEW